MSYFQFHAEQQIPAPVDQVWDFVSSPANLKEITPEHMGFEITTPGLPEKMFEGMIIGYKVNPLPGFRTNWVTEITHIKEGEYFVDEQRVGPYALWHHQHWIEPFDGGTIMRDVVTYCPPMGWLGAIANSLLIKPKLKEIFIYRKKALESKWGKIQ
jgi:ligand-binding SRPBCC domain-containing protein